ncbi:hypothetical protein METBIDRAFT_11619 [Metschnikowia bicuspidata var. bicuspidata NRRL YB-4993]|uniref:Uncharacterized protein n=1 Tax=Metschnikowia bicuspidata var. bicuspidata NRRL YB-4993 TaxID=869754 RepID=A0A1A0HAX5_9ASCO|nr:hypothetical protein METBIDRAFT_11619 [Metschnikowia bicuspidata var. bicuspidata NRRL YB-4993]OBA21032.1 hypothetical protein METBIDRAFT_11619 [Metschnikowia bicuspidata var. bicuspidata NRRL YB-4993]
MNELIKYYDSGSDLEIPHSDEYDSDIDEETLLASSSDPDSESDSESENACEKCVGCVEESESESSSSESESGDAYGACLSQIKPACLKIKPLKDKVCLSLRNSEALPGACSVESKTQAPSLRDVGYGNIEESLMKSTEE